MPQLPPLPQLLAAFGISAALVAGGLVLSGAPARARAAGWLAAVRRPSSAGVEPVAGSEVRWERVLLDGRPTDVRSCRAPTWTPERLLGHYEALALEQSPPGAPYLVQESAAGGTVLWLGEDGRHRAVIVEADEVGSRYRLVVDARPAGPRDASGPLPGGLDYGLPVAFSYGRQDGTGLVLLRADTDPSAATDALTSRLEAAGYAAIERETAPDGRVRARLRHAAGRLAAEVVATPDARGARVCLSFRADG